MNNNTKFVTAALVLTYFITEISAITGTLWFNVNETISVFADVSYSAQSKTFTTATNLNAPFLVSVYDPKTLWTVYGQHSTNMRTVAAGHKYNPAVETTVLPVQLLIGESNIWENIFVLAGFTMTGENVWSIKLLNVSTDLDDWGTFTLSDDANVGAYHFYNYTASETTFICFDAQTGNQLWTYSVPGRPFGFSDVQFSKDSSLLAFDAEGFLMVWETATGIAHAAPYTLPFNHDELPHTFAFFSNGQFDYISCGVFDLEVAKFDPKSKSYQTLWSYIPEEESFIGALDIAPIEGSIYLAAGWVANNSTQVVIEMRQIENMTLEWSYNTPSHTGDLQDFISDLVFDPSGYVAVSTWGDQSHTTPEVMLFRYDMGGPLWTAATPGSMLSVDLYHDGSSLWLAAAGKHIHANSFGSGGDLFSWQISLS